MGLGFPVVVAAGGCGPRQFKPTEEGAMRQDQLHKGDKAASAQAAVLHCLVQEAFWSCS